MDFKEAAKIRINCMENGEDCKEEACPLYSAVEIGPAYDKRQAIESLSIKVYPCDILDLLANLAGTGKAK